LTPFEEVRVDKLVALRLNAVQRTGDRLAAHDDIVGGRIAHDHVV